MRFGRAKKKIKKNSTKDNQPEKHGFGNQQQSSMRLPCNPDLTFNMSPDDENNEEGNP